MAMNSETLSLSMKTTTATLFSLPTEILEHIAFYYACPRVLGPPVPLTALLLLCKAVSYKLSAARHLYARVFKYKFSFSAIRRRGFEPKAGEWSWQLRWWSEVLRGVRSRRRRLGSEPYMDISDAEEAGVQETMYALWIMCLEDDGCNRVQMQLAGVYEWVEGYIRTEMYKTLDKGWPLANAGNSCAMWVFWYLSSKARLMDESTEQRESLIDLILPFLAVPFRYPSSFAPANHFRLPLRSSVPSSSSTPFSIPTPHGPFPIYLHPNRHTWLTPHFDRWTPLCTPLAADAAKLVYFSRRETMLFSVLDLLPRNREEHRARIRARLAAQGNGEIDEFQVETVLQSELPRPTQEDFEELNAGLLGGDMVPSSPFSKGGGTPLPRTYDPWDDARKRLPNLLDPRLNHTDISESNLDTAEQIFGGEIDESACSSRRWDADWWRLRLCRSAWVGQGEPESEDNLIASDVGIITNNADTSIVADVNDEEGEDCDDDGENDEVMSDYDGDGQQHVDMPVNGGAEESAQVEQVDNDMQRNHTMLTGYPQKGAVFTPGSLNGLWTGRMIIPDETHLRALLLPPAPTANQQELILPHNQFPLPDNDNHEDEPHPAVVAVQNPLNNANLTPNPRQEAGHRPIPFNEGTLGLVAVPLYVRLSEYAVYSGGRTVPCAHDTEDDNDYGTDFDFDGDDGIHSSTRSHNSGDSSNTTRAGSSHDTVPRSTSINPDDAFDQGIKDSWFPPNTTLSTKGDRVIASVPSSGPTNGGEYEYVAVRNRDISADDDFRFSPSVASTSTLTSARSEAEAQSQRKPGTFHDRETCTGCIARERALLVARTEAQALIDIDPEHPADASSDGSSDEDLSEEEPAEDLPPYVPSAKTIPPCNGIRDVLITGSTDPRHAAAWGKWVWRGRVRKWDGLVGLVRSVDSGPSGSSSGNGGGGKIFFYGTLLGGRNLVGTWRLAHEDPRMPAYEGAFTLGRKDE
ncbi:uncharacterized protein C8R40DRAFT_1175185 [Lentinula edodes]|uniref:uncharacterized protein n=1 Tax=Lentinula edodes TaxID=5353 RepID=UPI001E8D4E99|nr:uncharacterized protein C8R40DRAFT_1175185 [Lentinula edodes]KAH7870954.1 hypothetical protein C8R40DRAFT_1175185 [Lentinula edodes]